MKNSVILAIDQGTTGSTVLAMDQKLKVLAVESLDFEQHFPQPGWVEHDLEQIWTSVQKALAKVLKKVSAKRVVALGITNQRETICFWDRKTAKPLGRAIVWQDRRTAEACSLLKTAGHERKFQERTGLLLDPYFSGTKAAWAIKNWPHVAKAAQNGSLAVGTIDSYLVARLSGGAAHVTEPSNASRTLAFSYVSKNWDAELCRELGVPTNIWPEVKPSFGEFARTKGVRGLTDGLPITGILGDQQSALLGQACIQEGQAKCTYGTGAFLLMNTGNSPSPSKHRLLTTVAWAKSSNDYTYALEGSAFVAGAAVQWLRDGLGLIKDSAQVEKLALTVKSSEGVVFIPALAGLGAPHWDPHATGLFTGITRGTTKGHIARAVLEGIALQNVDILTAMEKDLGKKLTSLNVDGGAAANNLMMQYQADVLGVTLKRPKFLETTSLGAVFAAGIGCGVWSDLSDVEKSWKADREFLPKMQLTDRQGILKRWSQSVRRAQLL